MQGFFQQSQLAQSKAPPSVLPLCGACGLFKTCKSPKMDPSGKGKRRILLLGEAPGEHEDERGKQFVGKTGKLLERTLAKFGVDMREDCWLTNALICHPEDNIIKSKKVIDYCRPNLLQTLRKLQPDIIIPLGGTAVESLIGHLWKGDTGNITRWAGYRIPCQKPNMWVCPTFHPSFVDRSEQKKDLVVKKIWEDHLEAALSLKGKPWPDGPPDYSSLVRCIYDPHEAKRAMVDLNGYEGEFAFDYETTTLKPSSGGEIVCASLAWRDIGGIPWGIAFPWLPPASTYFLKLLGWPNPKVGYNIKFEEVWTRAAEGRVRNWKHDGMLHAHWTDSRRGTKSLKFQAFVQLGAEAYDDHIKPMLKARKGQRVNQILQEVNLKDLLKYCALDSLLELELAQTQMGDMSCGPSRSTRRF